MSRCSLINKDNSSISDDSSASVISNNPSKLELEADEFIQFKIKNKRMQLRVMWYIQFSILFVCLFEMILSAVQFTVGSIDKCDEMTGLSFLDGLIFFVIKFIGLVLWTLPVIYVYWGREYYAAIIAKRKLYFDDEEEDDIDQYFTDMSKEKSNGTIKRSENNFQNK